MPIHIYSPDSWHEMGYIVGDKDSLRRLRDAIDVAIDSDLGVAKGEAVDGEGFSILVAKIKPGEWECVPLHYTAPWVRSILIEEDENLSQSIWAALRDIFPTRLSYVVRNPPTRNPAHVAVKDNTLTRENVAVSILLAYMVLVNCFYIFDSKTHHYFNWESMLAVPILGLLVLLRFWAAGKAEDGDVST